MKDTAIPWIVYLREIRGLADLYDYLFGGNYMQCSKCGKEITNPLCPVCGFSHKDTVIYLTALAEEFFSLQVEISLSKSPSISELTSVEHLGEQGNIHACQLLADYYFKAVQHSSLLDAKKPEDYRFAKHISSDIARAVHWVKKLLFVKGNMSPGQKYLLALELMQSKLTGEEGLRYLKESAEAGYVRAIKLLIRCLEKGYFCDKDSATARIWKSRLTRSRAENLKLEFIDMVRDAWNGN